ncbi:MAG: T9SS type A sorting domain-containing protein [candidate division Zixibacteria bacterium]|nr:T9SS type A sorting domain-containing protein [candidate division Zixibacteria bacterium]
MIKVIIISLTCLLMFSGLSAQTLTQWQSIGTAGGITSDTQNNLKSMAGFISGGSTDDGTNTHWAGLRFKTTSVVDVEDNPVIPLEFALYQNYPNPFNPTTRIEYSLERHSNVSLIIYNILGQRVNKIVNENQEAGQYTVDWNGLDDNGIETASGIYFYKIVAGDFIEVKKMVLLK